MFGFVDIGKGVSPPLPIFLGISQFRCLGSFLVPLTIKSHSSLKLNGKTDFYFVDWDIDILDVKEQFLSFMFNESNPPLF